MEILLFVGASVNDLCGFVLTIFQSETKGAIEDKLDVWICVPVTVFLGGHPTQPYTELLQSGDLTHSDSLSLEVNYEFNQVSRLKTD